MKAKLQRTLNDCAGVAVNSNRVLPGLTILGMLFTSRSVFAALPIDILDMRYTVSVGVTSYRLPWETQGGTNYSRTNVSIFPTSDSLYHPVSGRLEAQANAGLFTLSAYTAAQGPPYDYSRQGSGARVLSEV